MHMQMPVVLLVAESRQDLTTAVLTHDLLSNGLDDPRVRLDLNHDRGLIIEE